MKRKRAAQRPLFFRGWRLGDGLRTMHEDLQLRDLNLNDWYGHGVLVGLGAEPPIDTEAALKGADVMTYAPEAACVSSYRQGVRDGRRLVRYVAADPPEE